MSPEEARQSLLNYRQAQIAMTSDPRLRLAISAVASLTDNPQLQAHLMNLWDQLTPAERRFATQLVDQACDHITRLKVGSTP